MMLKHKLITTIAERVFPKLAKRLEQEGKIDKDAVALVRDYGEHREACNARNGNLEVRCEDKLHAWIPFLLVLSWVMLVAVALYLYQRITDVSEKLQDVCESENSIVVFSGKELTRIRVTQSSILLLKIGLIVSSLSPVNKTMLQAGRYSARPAVNFIFNTSSTQDSGLIWMKSYGFDSSSFTSLGGAYINGEVTIPETGIYTIYCSFTLSTTLKSRNDFKTGTATKITQKLIRRKGRGIGEKTVMLQQQTELPSDDFEHKSIFLFGNVYLDKEDIVFPWLSNITAVYKMSITSYWGLFAVNLK